MENITKNQNKYDVIIVGAGSAGCVLAARLSEDSRRKILLLEAGPDYPEPDKLPPEIVNSHFPAFTHDWGYVSEPGLLSRSLHLARAKLVGGCSATNATFALRGDPNDYDEWAEIGNPGWLFSEVLPFFRRLESDADFDNEWHGKNGPLPIRRYKENELTPVQSAFLKACLSAAYKPVDDHNAPRAIGAGPMSMNTIAGVRQSTALTYLKTARRRANLTIKSGVLVDRVAFSGQRVVGVHLANRDEMLYANQVILSAGTYSSPAILMRSGIGPADHLEALEIEVLKDLPGVGQNLIDHPLFGLEFSAPMPAGPEDIPAFQTVLTLKSSKAIAGHDLQIIPTSIYPAEKKSEGNFTLMVALVKPNSRGGLWLRSKKPSDAPIIDLGYFTNTNDMLRMIEGVRIARHLSKTPPLSDFVLKEVYPRPEVYDDANDLESAVLSAVATYHHPVGTCRMGPAADKMAVVNAHGNTHGIAGLYVIDASIMPTIPAANTNLPTIMIAERCAAWLIDEV